MKLKLRMMKSSITIGGFFGRPSVDELFKSISRSRLFRLFPDVRQLVRVPVDAHASRRVLCGIKFVQVLYIFAFVFTHRKNKFSRANLPQQLIFPKYNKSAFTFTDLNIHR